jgi:hypothetical protein
MCWCYLCWCRTTASLFPLVKMGISEVVWYLEQRSWWQNVLLISRKSWRWALASSCAFSLNGVAYTMLMRLGLSSNSRLLVLSVGLVRMFVMLRTVNSHSVFLVIASKTGVELLLDWFNSDEWSLVNHNQPWTLYMIRTKKNKGKLVKAEVVVMISSISMHLLSLTIAFIAPPR